MIRVFSLSLHRLFIFVKLLSRICELLTLLDGVEIDVGSAFVVNLVGVSVMLLPLITFESLLPLLVDVSESGTVFVDSAASLLKLNMKIFFENSGVTNCCLTSQNRRAVSIQLSRTLAMHANISEKIFSNELYSFGMIPSTELSK